MGFLTSGPFSNLKGKTGNNVGRSVKGMNVFSIRPHKSSKKPTDPQLTVRKKLEMITLFLMPISNYIEVGFKESRDKLTSMNVAISLNYNRALIESGSYLAIDYPRIMFSKGKKVLPPKLPTLFSDFMQVLVITWKEGFVDRVFAQEDDRANLLIYNPKQDEYVFFDDVADRVEETHSIKLEESYIGETIYAYMNFVSSKQNTSNSVYLGCVEVR
jgi:hypothetical protein